MEAVKRMTAAAASDGARRRPLAPSEKNNAAPVGRRREGPASRFKPVAPPALAPAPSSAATRRCSSPSPGRASAAAAADDGGSATCGNNRARSADRARPGAASPAPSSSRLKPSFTTTVARSAKTPPRDSAADDGPPRARNNAKKEKASSGDLWAASARSSSLLLLRPDPVLQSPATAIASKVDRLVQGLPSSEQAKMMRSGALAERKRSPRRGSTNTTTTGDQCENAKPSESTANSVADKHRWPGMMTMTMMTARGASASTSAAPAEKASCRSDASAGRSPRRTHPSEATPGKSMTPRPSNEIAHRRRKDKADSGSDDDTSSQTSDGSKPTCRLNRVPVLHRSPRQGGGMLSAAASRSCQSPSRMRPSPPCQQSKCASSSAAHSAVSQQPVFNYSYIVDAWKGKKSAGHIENIHQLRLLSSRYLQWRFVNARSEESLHHKNRVQSILYGVWKSILTLRDAVTITRTNVRHLQQELKLYGILTEQIGYLEQWPILEEECNATLVEATEALKASTLRVPVTSGAHADGIAVRNAISSAVDVMQALSSSIYCVQSKVEDRTYLVSELSVIAGQEKVALDQCRKLLATAAKLQVQETSLRTLLMQLRQRDLEDDELTKMKKLTMHRHACQHQPYWNILPTKVNRSL